MTVPLFVRRITQILLVASCRKKNQNMSNGPTKIGSYFEIDLDNHLDAKKNPDFFHFPIVTFLSRGVRSPSTVFPFMFH